MSKRLLFLYELQPKSYNGFYGDILTEYAICQLNFGNIYLGKRFLQQAMAAFAGEQKKYFCSFVPSYLEALIRLRKLKQANDLCQKNFSLIVRGKANLIRLRYNICYYHMSIIKYKQKDYDSSLEYFAEFFKRMKEFCKGFLDESIYNNLEKEKAFEIIKEQKDIQKCLENSLKIFTAIYGRDHSFVKDYVAENCKNRSWLYEHIKITGYYLQYYWDCFMKFLGFDPLAL